MHVRLSDEDLSSTQSPLKLATPSNDTKISLVSSIKVLHQHLRDNEYITGLANHILQVFFSLHSNEVSLKKFEDTNYVPTSCRFKLEIRGTTRVKDNQ